MSLQNIGHFWGLSVITNIMPVYDLLTEGAKASAGKVVWFGGQRRKGWSVVEKYSQVPL